MGGFQPSTIIAYLDCPCCGLAVHRKIPAPGLRAVQPLPFCLAAIAMVATEFFVIG